MKRILIILSVLSCLCLSAVLPASAETGKRKLYNWESSRKIYDEANLFSISERDELCAEAQSLSGEFGSDVIVVTSRDNPYDTAENFAYELYTDYGFGLGKDSSGILFLIDMANREYTIITHGSVIPLYTEQHIEELYDLIMEDMTVHSYADAAERFLADVRRAFQKHANRNQTGRVRDEAGLFTTAQSAGLERDADILAEEQNQDIVIVTTDHSQGKTSEQYADDYYDDGGFGVGDDASGIMLLLDIDNRVITVITSGRAMTALPNTKVEMLYDLLEPVVAKGDYTGSAALFLLEVRHILNAGQQASWVYDLAGALGKAELQDCASLTTALHEDFGIDAAIVFVDGVQQTTLEEFAEIFICDNNIGTGEAGGLLFTVDISTDVCRVDRIGKAAWAFPSARIELIVQAMAGALSEGQYGDVAGTAFSETRKVLDGSYGKVGEPPTIDNAPYGMLAKKAIKMGLGLSFLILLIIRFAHNPLMTKQKGTTYMSAPLEISHRKDERIDSQTTKELLRTEVKPSEPKTQPLTQPKSSLSDASANTRVTSSSKIHGGGGGRSMGDQKQKPAGTGSDASKPRTHTTSGGNTFGGGSGRKF